MNAAFVNAVVQLVISLCGAGVLVQLLMLRQNRRKVAGDASSSEANAASTLSGAAIKMVENAQAKELEANRRADIAHTALVQEREEMDIRRERDAQELETRAWRIHHLEMRNAILENALGQAGIAVPPEPEYDQIKHRQQAPLGLEGPRPSIEIEQDPPLG